MWNPQALVHKRQLQTLRTDYLYEDKYASLGLAVLQRCPLGFFTEAEAVDIVGPELAASQLFKRIFSPAARIL